MITTTPAARLRLAAAVFVTAASAFGLEAWMHMRALGQLCGSGTAPHCAACYLAGAALIAGLSAAVAAELRERAHRLAARRVLAGG